MKSAKHAGDAVKLTPEKACALRKPVAPGIAPAISHKKM
jgi:hypothetical protein